MVPTPDITTAMDAIDTSSLPLRPTAVALALSINDLISAQAPPTSDAIMALMLLLATGATAAQADPQADADLHRMLDAMIAQARQNKARIAGRQH